MTEPFFPEPLDDDDDDVAWALQTAKVQWNRGGRVDAIVWLGRAADTADQVGKVWRAADLRRMVVALTESVEAPTGATAPLPRFGGGSRVDRGVDEESGVTSIPPPASPHASFSSYLPVEHFEVEPAEDVEVLDEAELEDDLIDDDALSLPVSTERSAAPASLPFADADDPVTQPFFDDPRLAELPYRSPLPPPPPIRTSRPAAPGSARPEKPGTLPPLAPLAPLGGAGARAALESESEEIEPEPEEIEPEPEEVEPEPEEAEAEPEPEAAKPQPAPEADPRLGDVLLGEVRGLEDVPPEGQAVLVHEAIVERLGVGDEISSFGLALVLGGAVSVMPAIADLSCARAGKGEIVWSQGHLEDGVVLRLVATEASTEVAVWSAELLKSTVRDYPWVVDDLKVLADRFQALAGVAMGPMGERLDDDLRASVTDRCEIRRLLPGEALTTKGKPVGGMYIVAAGRIEVVSADRVESELGPGDFLFGPQVLSNGAAPHDSRAGHGGALVLFAARAVAHDLLLSVPPLLEIFAT